MSLMQPIESYKYIGVLASFTAWLAIAIVLYKWPVIKSKSISKHVSAYKQAWILFACLETIALLLFYVFMINWFIPVLELPKIYEVLVTSALLLEFVTAWVPDIDGWKHIVHRWTAYSAVFLLPILTIFIALSPKASLLAQIVSYASVAVMLGIFGLYLTKKNTREKHLIYQSIYFACFHIPVLTVIFTVK